MEHRFRFYIGTYTEGITLPAEYQAFKRGIYLVEYAIDTGTWEILSVTEDVKNPSYLVIDDKQEYLYAVNELGNLENGECGAVSSFRINPDNGQLTLISCVSSLGAHPCHVRLDQQNRRLFVSNYSSGNGCQIAIGDNGVLGEPREIKGHDMHQLFQGHAHSMTFDRQEKRLLLADLGLDRLYRYDYDKKTGALQESEPAFYQIPNGSGPRHCLFDESGEFCYVIQELSSEMMVLRYQNETGELQHLQTISTLPVSSLPPTNLTPANANNSCAALRLSADGKFLYASNRGDDSIVSYERDCHSGRLKLLGWEAAGGHMPRDIAFSPSENYMIAANQDSHNVVVFERDSHSGRLQMRNELPVPAPVCIVFTT